MSPLGTLVVGSSSSSSEKSPYGFNEPLLRLMSLSLVNNPGASAAAFFSNLHCQAAAAAAAHSLAMQFKNSSEEPPKSSPTSTEDQTNDEDEVLSIGREDEEQMVIDCDSDEVESDRTTECLDEDRVISPDGEESQDFKKGPSRESLMFSIANILRPDFGQPPQQQQQQISPSKSLQRSMQHQLNHHLFKLNQQSESLRKSSSASSHHRLQTKHRRSDLPDPIDLSRPQGDVKVGKFQDHKSSSSSPTEIRARKHPVKNTDEGKSSGDDKDNKNLWPAWVYCTRYSDRPSSGPRTRRTRKKEKEVDEKRPRTAFTADQLQRLKKEFDENRYLTEKRRQDLARDLRLHENQIKIWFQNKRAKLKKSTGQRGGLALQLMAQGLYNHSTIPPKTDQEGSDDSD